MTQLVRYPLDDNARAHDMADALRVCDWSKSSDTDTRITIGLLPGVEITEATYGWRVTAANMHGRIMDTPSQAVLAWIEMADALPPGSYAMTGEAAE